MKEKINYTGQLESTGKKDKSKKENMFGISYDPKRKRYIVRLLIEKGKPFIYKEFSVNKYQSQTTAKQAAMEYRNEQVVNWLIPCKRVRKSIDLKNNKTGVTGVNRRIRNGERIYVATWYDENNKSHKMQFSENKWKDKQAFFMAWATRIEKDKIFKKDKITGESIKGPDQCFDIVYDEVGKEKAEKIWKNEKSRAEEQKKTEEDV